MTNQREMFFATCAPGVEQALHEEAKELALAKVERQVGGVAFEGTLHDAMRANLWLRCAVRILMRVARFPADDDRKLYDGARSVDWTRFVAGDGSFVVDAHTNGSVLDHSLFVAQRVKDAIVDGFREREGRRPNVDKQTPDVGVHAHLVNDRCTLLVDTSGDSLHKRGWRRYQGRAPLSETLAAAVVRYSGWDRRAPLIDPFCGGGTLLIEAAHLARGIAPGSWRESFGFQRWPGFDAAAWERMRAQAKAAARPAGKLVLRGRDWDPATLEGARENLIGAGLEGSVELELGEASEFDARKGWNAWIVTNPPYGERVGTERGLEDGHRRFGEFLRARCSGYHLALLSSNPRLIDALGLEGVLRRALRNGALDCTLATARIA